MKEIVHYKQRGSTCAICCMLMVLASFEFIVKARKYDEKRLFYKLKSRYMDGTPFASIAWYLAKQGIECELLHSENNYFKNESSYIEDKLFECLLDEYETWVRYCKDKGVVVECDWDLSTEELKFQLDCGKKIILAGMANQTLHAILIVGYNENGFMVNDPLESGVEIIDFNKVNEFMYTPIGKWCICIKNKSISIV